MAISFIGLNQGAAATVPTHQVGDLILVAAFRDNNTPASLASGYTNINTVAQSGGTAASVRVGYKIAASNSETRGTWTNAYWYFVSVYRGVSGIGGSNTTTGPSNTVLPYPSVNMTSIDGSSFLVAIGYKESSSVLNTVPSGWTKRDPRNTLWQQIDNTGITSSPNPTFSLSPAGSGTSYSTIFELLATPTGGTTGKMKSKSSGTFGSKVMKVKSGGTFADALVKIKVSGSWEETNT